MDHETKHKTTVGPRSDRGPSHPTDRVHDRGFLVRVRTVLETQPNPVVQAQPHGPVQVVQAQQQPAAYVGQDVCHIE